MPSVARSKVTEDLPEHAQDMREALQIALVWNVRRVRRLQRNRRSRDPLFRMIKRRRPG